MQLLQRCKIQLNKNGKGQNSQESFDECRGPTWVWTNAFWKEKEASLGTDSRSAKEKPRQNWESASLLGLETTIIIEQKGSGYQTKEQAQAELEQKLARFEYKQSILNKLLQEQASKVANADRKLIQEGASKTVHNSDKTALEIAFLQIKKEEKLECTNQLLEQVLAWFEEIWTDLETKLMYAVEGVKDLAQLENEQATFHQKKEEVEAAIATKNQKMRILKQSSDKLAGVGMECNSRE